MSKKRATTIFDLFLRVGRGFERKVTARRSRNHKGRSVGEPNPSFAGLKTGVACSQGPRSPCRRTSRFASGKPPPTGTQWRKSRCTESRKDHEGRLGIGFLSRSLGRSLLQGVNSPRLPPQPKRGSVHRATARTFSDASEMITRERTLGTPRVSYPSLCVLRGLLCKFSLLCFLLRKAGMLTLG